MGGAGPHTLEEVFGVRRFETRGAKFYLNGEPVALMGVERMSNVDCGDRLIWLSPDRYSNPGERWHFYNSLVEKLSVLPGVRHVAATMDTPFWGASGTLKFSYDGQPSGIADHNLVAGFNFVTPGYFTIVQTPLLQGRDFNLEDRPGSTAVVIINRAMAHRLWPGQNAIGKRLHFWGKGGDFLIVGIAGDVRYGGPAKRVDDEIYMSVQQGSSQGLTFLLRTGGDPLAFVESARRVVASIDPAQAIQTFSTLKAFDDENIAGERTSTLVAAILGTMALLLACIGVYGVMAYSVSRRQREFGIRIALGSSRSGILKLLFSGVFRLVGLGVILGGILTFVMHAWTASLLGANGTSVVSLVASALLLCVVALRGCRAGDIHPRASCLAYRSHTGSQERIEDRDSFRSNVRQALRRLFEAK